MSFLGRIKQTIRTHHIFYRVCEPIYRSLLILYYKTILRHRVLARKYPADLNLEITTRCNAQCTYCARKHVIQDGIRESGDIHSALVKKIINEFSTIVSGGAQISPDGLGEPFLSSEVFDILSSIRTHIPNAFIHANSNAINLDEEMIEKVINSPLDSLILSINSWDNEVYKKINGVDKFEKVTKNIENFLQRKGDKSPSAVLQLLDIDVNKEHREAFYNYWKPRLNENDTIYLRPFNDFGGTISYTAFKNAPIPRVRFPCYSLFNTIMIDKDGYIYPCCVGLAHGNESDICLGNIAEITLQKIFSDGEQIHKLRALHLHNKYEMICTCKDCNSWAVMPTIFLKFGKKWL